MSDTQDPAAYQTEEAAAPPAHAMVVNAPHGNGFIGIMHAASEQQDGTAGKVRAFWGNSLERVQALFSKVGVAELGLSQADADAVGANAVAAHPDSGEGVAAVTAPGTVDEEAQKTIEDLETRLTAAEADRDAAEQLAQDTAAENAALREKLRKYEPEANSSEDPATGETTGDGSDTSTAGSDTSTEQPAGKEA